MIEEKYIELINKEIDGVNSPKDSAKLEEYLTKNTEAQELYSELVMTSNMLNNVNELEPHPNLKKNILNSIQWDKYTVKASKARRNPFESLINALQFNFNFKYAYAFAVGLIMGIVTYSLFVENVQRNTSTDISDLYGTMILKGIPESFEIANYIEINLDEVYGTINIRYSKDIVLAELNLKTQQEIEMVFEFDEDDIRFNGFIQLNNVRNNLDISENYLKLTNIGENKYIIIFNDKTQSVTPMNFKIFLSDVLLYEKSVSTGRKSE